MSSVPNGIDPEPNINRQGPDPKPRNIGGYIEREVPAPQPAGPKSIAGRIECEANKRQNPSN